LDQASCVWAAPKCAKEIAKRNKAHGAGQPRSGGAVFLAPFENQREDGEDRKAEGHHEERSVVQAGQMAEPVAQVERHGQAA
jgi:hypothetical protein